MARRKDAWYLKEEKKERGEKEEKEKNGDKEIRAYFSSAQSYFWANQKYAN